MHAAVLKYLDHVARHGSIRKAAEALNVASSAVNRQILRLEAQIGAPLFERRRSGVRPTAAGEVLLRHVRDTQGDFERARSEIAGLRGIVTGEVRIVSIESLLARFLPSVVAEMAARYPQVSFTLLNVDPSHMAEELRSGRNDLGVLFVDNQLRGFEVVAELRTAVGAVMRADHPLARRRQLTLTECAAFPVVMLHDRWLLDAVMATEFAESGARLSPRIVSNSIEFMRQIIKSGLGIGFFTPIGFLDEIRRGELVHVRLAERGLANSRIGIVVPAGGRPPSLAARLVIEQIRERLTAFSQGHAVPALILSGGAVLTVNAADEVLPAADLRIEDGRIAAIGPAGTLAQPGDMVIDCRDALVMPGLVNVHTHAGTALFRGLVEDAPREFWSGRYSVPGQEHLTADDYALSASAACAEFLLNGVTTIADRLGGMDRIAPAIADSGIRAAVGQTLSDAAAPPDWRTAEAVIERFGVDPAASRVFAGIAPHALDSCSDALLAECARRAERLGARVFIHVAQSAPEVAAVRGRGHDGALGCMAAAGLVGGHVVAAHCIYLGESELEDWPRHGIAIAHCPASNLKIEARTLPLHRLIGRVPIGLGTDWTVTDNAMDLLAEARLAALVGKLLAGDPQTLPVRQMIRMLTIDGARVLGLDHLVGSIEPGKRADLVVLDLSALEANPRHNLAANVLYSMTARCVRDVMVDGTLLVRDFRLTRCEAASMARVHDTLAAKLQESRSGRA